MNLGLSEKVRKTAEATHLRRAKLQGLGEFSIHVLDMQHELRKEGFPPNHVRQICEALRSQEFLRRNRLNLLRTDGPPSLTSTTVIFHYAFAEGDRDTHAPAVSTPSPRPAPDSHVKLGGTVLASAMPSLNEGNKEAQRNETSAQRARRLTNSIRGILKDELAEYGGGEAFLRWIRSDESGAA